MTQLEEKLQARDLELESIRSRKSDHLERLLQRISCRDNGTVPYKIGSAVSASLYPTRGPGHYEEIQQDEDLEQNIELIEAVFERNEQQYKEAKAKIKLLQGQLEAFKSDKSSPPHNGTVELQDQLERAQSWAKELYDEVQRLTSELHLVKEKQQQQQQVATTSLSMEGVASIFIEGPMNFPSHHSEPELELTNQAEGPDPSIELQSQVDDLNEKMERAKAWAAELHQAVQERDSQLEEALSRELKACQDLSDLRKLQGEQIMDLEEQVAALQDTLEEQRIIHRNLKSENASLTEKVGI